MTTKIIEGKKLTRIISYRTKVSADKNAKELKRRGIKVVKVIYDRGEYELWAKI